LRHHLGSSSSSSLVSSSSDTHYYEIGHMRNYHQRRMIRLKRIYNF
jgi:hypothetical protein